MEDKLNLYKVSDLVQYPGHHGHSEVSVNTMTMDI